MTTHDSHPAPTHDGLDAPLSSPPPGTEREEPSLGSSEPFGESTRGDPGLGETPRGDVIRDGDHAGTDADGVSEGVAEGAALIDAELSSDYRARWNVVQGDFIDEPRKAVTDADSMVGEVLDQLAQTFRQQRQALEQNWAEDKPSTEDLRIALRRYRAFFERLLSF